MRLTTKDRNAGKSGPSVRVRVVLAGQLILEDLLRRTAYRFARSIEGSRSGLSDARAGIRVPATSISQ